MLMSGRAALSTGGGRDRLEGLKARLLSHLQSERHDTPHSSVGETPLRVGTPDKPLARRCVCVWSEMIMSDGDDVCVHV